MVSPPYTIITAVGIKKSCQSLSNDRICLLYTSIEMRVRHEVIAINPEKQTVKVKNLNTGEIFEESYDKLLIATGAKPVWPDLPGIRSEKLFTLRTVEDTFRIREFVEKNQPKSVVLAGGGYIGLELAENFREMGMDVTICLLYTSLTEILMCWFQQRSLRQVLIFPM